MSDLHSAVVTGVGTLKGPLHGGAAESVMKMAQDIGDPANAENYARTTIEKGERIMGFGHRVYKNYDPRAAVIKEKAAQVLDSLKIDDPLLDIAKSLEEVALKDEFFIERKLFPNVDFYSGIIYRAMGIPTEMFTVMFALGRLPGWLAHWREMIVENQKINRPRQIYTGDIKRSL